MDIFARALENLSKKKPSYRLDLRITAMKADEDEGILWVQLEYPEGRIPAYADIYFYLSAHLEDKWEIDKEIGVIGIKGHNLLWIPLRPYIEKIPVRSEKDIPSGFKNIGAGIFEYVDAEGNKSFWELKKIKGENGEEEMILVRRDMKEPLNPVPPVKVKREAKDSVVKRLLKVGKVIPLRNGLGEVVEVKDDSFVLRPIGQEQDVNKLIKVLVPSKYSKEEDREVLRDYYRKIFPDDFVEALLEGY